MWNFPLKYLNRKGVPNHLVGTASSEWTCHVTSCAVVEPRCSVEQHLSRIHLTRLIIADVVAMLQIDLFPIGLQS